MQVEARRGKFGDLAEEHPGGCARYFEEKFGDGWGVGEDPLKVDTMYIYRCGFDFHGGKSTGILLFLVRPWTFI